MEQIELVELNEKYREELKQYFTSFYIEDFQSELKYNLKNQMQKDFEDWFQTMIFNSNENTVMKGHVLTSFYIVFRMSNHDIIGMAEIRHQLNTFLKENAGNIGYSIIKEERNKGFGKQVLPSLMRIGKKLGFEEFTIICYESNLPSSKIIQQCGGKLVKKRKDKIDNICYYKLLLE